MSNIFSWFLNECLYVWHTATATRKKKKNIGIFQGTHIREQRGNESIDWNHWNLSEKYRECSKPHEMSKRTNEGNTLMFKHRNEIKQGQEAKVRMPKNEDRERQKMSPMYFCMNQENQGKSWKIEEKYMNNDRKCKAFYDFMHVSLRPSQFSIWFNRCIIK